MCIESQFYIVFPAELSLLHDSALHQQNTPKDSMLHAVDSDAVSSDGEEFCDTSDITQFNVSLSVVIMYLFDFIFHFLPVCIVFVLYFLTFITVCLHCFKVSLIPLILFVSYCFKSVVVSYCICLFYICVLFVSVCLCFTL